MLSILLSFSALLINFASAYYPAYLTAGTTSNNAFAGYVAAFPTGNGTNAAILVNSTSQALTGHFHGSYWVFDGFGNKTYSLYMEPTANSAQFPLYGTVGINFGLTTSGFGNTLPDAGHTQTSGLLVWEHVYGAPANQGPDDMADGGSMFAVCSTLVPGFEAAGLQKVLFWPSMEIVEMSYGVPNCTFVSLTGADLENQGP